MSQKQFILEIYFDIQDVMLLRIKKLHYRIEVQEC